MLLISLYEHLIKVGNQYVALVCEKSNHIIYLIINSLNNRLTFQFGIVIIKSVFSNDSRNDDKNCGRDQETEPNLLKNHAK